METNRLFTAIRQRNSTQVRALVESGMDPDTQFYLSGTWRSSVSLAAEMGCSEIVEILCKHRCNPSGLKTDEAPLISSCRGGDVRSVNALLKHRANVRSTDISGKTPLHYAASVKRHCIGGELTKLLLARDAEVDAEDMNGRTPLMYAAYVANIEVVQLLLSHGSNPCKVDLNGMTVLHLLLHNGLTSENSPKILGIVMKAMGEEGTLRMFINRREYLTCATPLHCAIQSCRKGSNPNLATVVEMLIEHGADINVQTSAGQTPLHLACNAKQFDSARILIAAGCLLTLNDLLGRPAMAEALRLRDSSTLNLILKASGNVYFQEVKEIISKFWPEPEKQKFLDLLKNPGSLLDHARRCLIRATSGFQNINEIFLPRSLQSFLKYEDCI